MIKILSELRIEGNFYKKSTGNLILSGITLNAFLLRLGTRKDVCSHVSY